MPSSLTPALIFSFPTRSIYLPPLIYRYIFKCILIRRQFAFYLKLGRFSFRFIILTKGFFFCIHSQPLSFLNFLLPFSLDETTKTYATSLVSFTKALEACGNEYVGECLKKTIIMGECLRIVENNVGSWKVVFSPLLWTLESRK